MSAIIQPGLGDVHIDVPLTQLSIAFRQESSKFVATRVFPTVPVQKASNKYFTLPRGYFYRDEMKLRAPGTESAQATMTISNDNYSCDVYGVHTNVADQIRANADSPLDLDRQAAEFLTLKALLKIENDFVSNWFTTSVWTTEYTGVAAAPGANQFLQWNDAASTPIEDMRARASDMEELTGYRPNVLTLGRRVFDKLLDHPDIVGRLDRGQTSGTAMVMRETLAALFEVDEVLVMAGTQNTAVEGAADSFSYIGGKAALLSYRPQSPGLMTPSAGYSFEWTGYAAGLGEASAIRRFRMEELRSDRLELEQAYDQKVVSADLGVFFASAVA